MSTGVVHWYTATIPVVDNSAESAPVAFARDLTRSKTGITFAGMAGDRIQAIRVKQTTPNTAALVSNVRIYTAVAATAPDLVHQFAVTSTGTGEPYSRWDSLNYNLDISATADATVLYVAALGDSGVARALLVEIAVSPEAGGI